MKSCLFLIMMSIYLHSSISISELSWKEIVGKVQEKQYKRMSHEAEVNELFQSQEYSSSDSSSNMTQENPEPLILNHSESLESCTEKSWPQSLHQLKTMIQQSNLFMFVFFEFLLVLLFLYFMARLLQTIRMKTLGTSDHEIAAKI